MGEYLINRWPEVGIESHDLGQTIDSIVRGALVNRLEISSFLLRESRKVVQAALCENEGLVLIVWSPDHIKDQLDLVIDCMREAVNPLCFLVWRERVAGLSWKHWLPSKIVRASLRRHAQHFSEDTAHSPDVDWSSVVTHS